MTLFNNLKREKKKTSFLKKQHKTANNTKERTST